MIEILQIQNGKTDRTGAAWERTEAGKTHDNPINKLRVIAQRESVIVEIIR